MVILKRIFSDNDLFNEVRFKKGINIIQGKYSTNRELNGIGKSTLVRLIDFALLSDSGAKKYFDPKKYEFLKESSVILEFETNNQQIYFAKRNFEDPQVPRFGPELSNLTPYKDDQLKLRFGNLFFGQNDYNGIYKDSWFRTLIKFFIKDDINNFERKNPLKFYNNMANDFESYIYNLFLLNLPNEPVNNYKESRTKEKELRKSYNNEKIRIESDSGKKLEEKNSEIAILSNKIK